MWIGSLEALERHKSPLDEETTKDQERTDPVHIPGDVARLSPGHGSEAPEDQNVSQGNQEGPQEDANDIPAEAAMSQQLPAEPNLASKLSAEQLDELKEQWESLKAQIESLNFVDSYSVVTVAYRR